MSLDQLPDSQVLTLVAGGIGLLTLLLFILLLVTRAHLARAQSETLLAESAAAQAAKAAEARDATQAAEFAAFRKKYSAITDQETEVARLAVNRHPKGTPYRRAKGTPLRWGSWPDAA